MKHKQLQTQITFILSFRTLFSTTRLTLNVTEIVPQSHFVYKFRSSHFNQLFFEVDSVILKIKRNVRILASSRKCREKTGNKKERKKETDEPKEYWV